MFDSLAFLGPSGTHSEELARLAFPESPLREYPTISDCIQAVADLQTKKALVPIENSLEGAVNITLDLLARENRLFITKEFIWPIRHHLLCNAPDEMIHTIYSHPQALAQCRNYLRRTLPEARLVPSDSTAAAAQSAANKGSGFGAIASKRCAALYALTASENNIADREDNHTRFVLLEATLNEQSSAQTKTSLVCRMQGNTPGSLYLLLSVFAKNAVNLLRIESRPAQTKLGEYIFFLDMEGGLHDPTIASTLRGIREHCSFFSILGSYPSQTF